MSGNPLTAKIAVPYANALFDFSLEKNIMHQITADFQNLNTFLDEASELMSYLNSPVIKREAKSKILEKTLKPQINIETFKFLMVLVERNRINLLPLIITSYLELVYKAASIKMVNVSSACAFSNTQKNLLIQKLKELTNSREIQLIIKTNPNLIGGFLIQTDSKIIDFTIKNRLQQLAKHLDTILEI